MKFKPRKFMIVAGEASGDLHAAKLVRALREASPEAEFEFFGAAGSHLREAGVEPVVRSDGLAIVGLTEIGRSLPMFLKAFRELKRVAIERRPDAVILVDFPDFNLKLAKSLKKQGLTVVYYISPQIWAWRKYRVKSVLKYVDLMLTILPFEKVWYSAEGVNHVEYVGSPLAREVFSTSSKEEFCTEFGLSPAKPIISLLPGSRHKEISRVWPVIVKASEMLSREIPEIQFVVALSSNHRSEIVSQAMKCRASITLVVGRTYDALNASDAAAITSGTATLEAAIIGTPMVIVYKTSVVNYKLLRPLISVDHFGLVNLIAGERIAKELIQDDFTAETLSEELLGLLKPEKNREMRGRLRAVADKLGHGGASKRAAEAILKLLDGR